MKFKTAITNIDKDGHESIRGHGLLDLMRDHGFVASIFLLLKGDLPNEAEERMMDAILTAIIDHGPGTASGMTARISASAKNTLHSSVAAGLLGLGERHGVVIEKAMRFFQEHKDTKDLAGLLQEMKARKAYVMGYGHRLFTDKDPRAVGLIELAEEFGLAGVYTAFTKDVEKALNEISSRGLPTNADGAIAGILLDMGFDPAVGNGVFVIARTPGLVAQVIEERTRGEGMHRMPQEQIEFIA